MCDGLYSFDREFAGMHGFVVYCGADEVGRGPLAGPLYAAAVHLNGYLEGLNDSKKLSGKRREELFEKITDSADWSAARAEIDEIETLNIRNASMLAMNRAVHGLLEKVECDGVFVDGDYQSGFLIPARTVVKGDSKSASIAAASIVAKVLRDREMVRLHELYPEYNFKRHKGYGTAEHYSALYSYGPCGLHRQSFLTKYYKRIGEPPKPTRGEIGERLAAAFAEGLGYRIAGRNFHTRFGEVDIICEDGEYIVFLEVKLRKDNSFSEAMELVDKRKQARITAAALEWLQRSGVRLQPRFDVLEIYLPGRDLEEARYNHIKNAFGA
ncbi:MAG: ribonuclease HII [Oscillospiraceae bacterium]|jgi:ribonuclease HII|nr:ribonuclease HII [Oscillospiraceae bacterium]